MSCRLIAVVLGCMVFGGETHGQTPDDTARLVIGDAKPASLPPSVRPAECRHVAVFDEPGRYGGWPANGGAWVWGNEILVGFTAAWYKPAKNDHAVDRTKPFEKWQARSLDGGETWAIEKPGFSSDRGRLTPKQLSEPLDFNHPDCALVFHFTGMHAGPTYFYASSDRGRKWHGPYALKIDGADNISSRTDYLVQSPRECLMFGSMAKTNMKEGRPFCARTTDGGQTWRLVGLIGPEPTGFAIMPSTLRLEGKSLLTTIRNGEPKKRADIDAWRSDDDGKTWKCLGPATGDIGGNPPALVRLPDGRICLTYGYRRKPCGVRARITADEGRTWGPEIIVRQDGLTGDLGYPRSVVRTDGKIVTMYYFNGPKSDDQRTIQASIWKP